MGEYLCLARRRRAVDCVEKSFASGTACIGGRWTYVTPEDVVNYVDALLQELYAQESFFGDKVVAAESSSLLAGLRPLIVYIK